VAGAKKAKHAGGRPTKYKPEMAEQARLATGRGFTDKDLARLFGVDERTINRWKDDYPEFCQSLQAGKVICDEAVEKSLFQRAMGYTVPDTHISNYQGDVTVTPIVKHYPPDPASMIFWLKNRRPDRWRDKQEVEHSGKGLDAFLAFLKDTASGERNLTDNG
jgi:hypothetical protein